MEKAVSDALTKSKILGPGFHYFYRLLFLLFVVSARLRRFSASWRVLLTDGERAQRERENAFPKKAE